jgi:prepilin-type processing-associated H-X9-DG protein
VAADVVESSPFISDPGLKSERLSMNQQTPRHPAATRVPSPPSASILSMGSLAGAIGVTALAHALHPLPTAALLGLPAVLLGGLSLLRSFAGARTVIDITGAVGGIALGISAAALVLARADTEPSKAESAAFHPATAPAETPIAMQEAREQANRLRCAANLRAISVALQRHVIDHGEQTRAANLESLDTAGLLRSAQLQSVLDSNSANAVDYFFTPEVRLQTDPAGWLVAWGDPAYSSGHGANVLYADGQAEFLNQDQFEKVMKRFLSEFEQKHRRKPNVLPPH